MKKRVLSLVLALAMCLGLAGTALADRVDGDDEKHIESYGGEYTCGNWTYDLNEDGTAILQTSHVTYESLEDRKILALPTELDGHPVTSVGEMAFYLHSPWMEAIPQKLVIPEGYTSISRRAFDGLSIREVVLPSTLTTIGESAFFDAYFTSVDVPESVTMADYAFSSCNYLEKITIRNNELDPSKLWVMMPNKLTEIACLPNSPAEAFAIEKGLTVTRPDAAVQSQEAPPAPVEPAVPSQIDAPAVTADPTSATVLVNGQNIAFDAYNIGGANFFKLRDLAYVLFGTEKQFEVSYDNATRNIALTSGQPYTAVGGELAPSSASGAQDAAPTPSTILLDGQEVSLTAYLINGSNYFMLRDIGSLFDFGIGWDGATRTITIDTSTGYAAE